jgi:beta-glucosidase
MYDALGDRVTGWITINEPWCVSFLGYAAGVHAPGRQDDVAAVHAAHHALLAHGLTVEALRAQGATNVGITTNLYHVMAASDSEADSDAARRVDGLQNRFFLDPVLRGSYPADVIEDLAAVTDFAHVLDGDLELIGAPIDFLGVNYYSRYRVAAASSNGGQTDAASAKAGAHGARRAPWVGSEDVVFRSSGLPLTAMGWEVDSDGLRQVLVRVAREYDAPPIYVTENGAAYADVLRDGDVDDPERIAYVNGHLAACAAAIAEGADLRGYFLWSLLDNFEWSWGYTRRFGIVHVDYATQVRTPKASARWYRQLMAGD